MSNDSPAQVYVVTSGEYSDYRVEAVYLDRRLADRHAAMVLYSYGRVEVLPVRTQLPVKAMLYVRIFRKHTGADEILDWGPELAFDDELTMRPRVHEVDQLIRVEGYDRARVDKVYGERVAKFKAEQAGVT